MIEVLARSGRQNIIHCRVDTMYTSYLISQVYMLCLNKIIYSCIFCLAEQLPSWGWGLWVELTYLFIIILHIRPCVEPLGKGRSLIL